jgi:hypothetical protein
VRDGAVDGPDRIEEEVLTPHHDWAPGSYARRYGWEGVPGAEDVAFTGERRGVRDRHPVTHLMYGPQDRTGATVGIVGERSFESILEERFYVSATAQGESTKRDDEEERQRRRKKDRVSRLG